MPNPFWKRALWFGLLWCVGVACVGIVSYTIRWMIL
ncbi:DUF2474 family protein [Rhodobacteraceae bacterium RKSG542]|nr:DUF2474 family protein [Pseudovibrio flavus]